MQVQVQPQEFDERGVDFNSVESKQRNSMSVSSSALEVSLARQPSAIPRVQRRTFGTPRVQRRTFGENYNSDFKRKLCGDREQMQNNVSFFERHVLHWWLFFLGFGMLAWWSLVREVWFTKRMDTTEQMQSREPLWDIGKFCLMCLVWLTHANKPAQIYWAGWLLPAFFFLSGLVTAPAEVDVKFGKKLAVRVLRDNLFNGIFLSVLIHFFRGGCFDSVSAWFLPALGTCQIGIPLCFHLTRRAGEFSASTFLVAVALVLPYMLEVNKINLPIPPCLGLECCGKCEMVSLRIMHSWIFYVFGFLTNSSWLASKLKNRDATCTAAALVGLLYCITWQGIVQEWTSILIPYGESYAEDGWRVYVSDILAKQFFIVLFLACLAPVARIGGLIPQVLAQLGQRTLHAYLINVFLYWLGRPGKLSARLFNPFTYKEPLPLTAVEKSASYVALIFATSVACCPLTESCVWHLTSPQWIFDVGAKVISVIPRQKL